MPGEALGWGQTLSRVPESSPDGCAQEAAAPGTVSTFDPSAHDWRRATCWMCRSSLLCMWRDAAPRGWYCRCAAEMFHILGDAGYPETPSDGPISDRYPRLLARAPSVASMSDQPGASPRPPAAMSDDDMTRTHRIWVEHAVVLGIGDAWRARCACDGTGQWYADAYAATDEGLHHLEVETA